MKNTNYSTEGRRCANGVISDLSSQCRRKCGGSSISLLLIVQGVHHTLKEMPQRLYSGFYAEVEGVSGFDSNDESWLKTQDHISIL